MSEPLSDEVWLLNEHTFWEVSDAVEITIYREEDILGALESCVLRDFAEFTVRRCTMTGEAFERLNENNDEDAEDYAVRMATLNDRLAVINERHERAKLPHLPGIDEPQP